MLPMPTEHADTQYARRLAALMDHLGMSQTQFCSATQLDPGYVSKILSGNLGKGRELSKLHERTLAALGLSGHFWTATSDISPEKALPSKPLQGGDMSKSKVDIGSGLARLAREMGETSEMVSDLLGTVAPPDADAVWWTRRYLELQALYGPRK